MYHKTIFDRIAALFFPNRCLFCDKVMSYTKNDLWVCPTCAKTLVFLDEVHTCALCGCPLNSNEKLCNTCQTHPHNFNRAISCLTYDGDTREAILQYKFYGRRELCRPFSAMMTRRVLPLHKANPFDVVLCAPLSKTSYRKRGYNQSALLASRIANNLKLPFTEDAFQKTKETPKQSTLRYQERMHNVQHAFRLAIPWQTLKGKRIILVDDVLTTGATADALAKLLKRAGAAYILVVTIAATERQREDSFTPEELKAIVF